MSAVDALNLNEEDSKSYDDECPLNRLFVGIIDINKWEEDAQCLYSKLLEEGDSFKTEFWRELLPVEVQKNIINLPSTIEQLKEAKRVYDVNGVLESYNNFMPRNQYFKPHTANAKRFLHNAEFINRQIKIHNANIECIS